MIGLAVMVPAVGLCVAGWFLYRERRLGTQGAIGGSTLAAVSLLMLAAQAVVYFGWEFSKSGGEDSVTLAFPTQSEQSAGVWVSVLVASDGGVTLNGTQVDPAQLADELLKNPEFDGVAVTIDGYAPAKEAVGALAQIKEVSGLILTEGNQRFRALESAGKAPVSQSVYEEVRNRPAFEVSVAYGDALEACSVLLVGQDRLIEVSSEDLFNLSYEHLRDQVVRAGGIEQFDRSTGFAVINTTADTPWSCVGGVIYSLQSSGRDGVVLKYTHD
jgi:hypothetical protein